MTPSEAQSEGACEGFGVCCDVANMELNQCSICACVHTEESDSDDENSESGANDPSSEDVGKPVADAIATIQAEILELDTMGFDETVVLDESVDM